MKIQLTERQKTIVNSLSLKGSKESQNILDELENGQLAMTDIEEICNLINNEFLMDGILPSFEPNVYGWELEALLDVVNSARIKS